MSATIVDVAEAITNELNATYWNPSFTAIRSYADFDDRLEELGTIAVDVVPVSATSTLETVSELDYICTCSVLLRQKLLADEEHGKVPNDDIDQLVDLLQQIHEYFAPSQSAGQSGRRLAAMSEAEWDDASGIKAPYSRKMLREHTQYSGWLHIVYRVPHAPGS